jgi:adhesin/invasin
VAGVTVNWTVTGGGLVSAPMVATGADGRAAVKWTLGTTAGAQTATAAATGLVGSPIVFDATAVVGAAGKLSITTQPSSTAQSGVAFARQPQIQLLDAHDNPVRTAGVAITATIASGAGASLIGSLIAGTDANGLATFSGLGLSAPAGTYRLSFSGPNISGVTSADVVVGAGSATALSFAVPPSATASSGVPLTTQPAIQLVDGSGNAVAQPGKTIVAAIQSGTGTLSGTTSITTSGSGVATFTNLALSGAAGSQIILSFSASGLVGVSSGTITIGAGTVSAGNSTLAVTGSPITASTGASAATITVTARDASNNVIPGAAVAVAVTGDNSVTQPAGGVANGSGVATATVSSTEAGIKTVTATINGTTITQQGTIAVYARDENAAAQCGSPGT